MRALVQRVTRAVVRVDGEAVGAIGAGLCVLVGVTHDDAEAQARKLAERLWKLRIFPDDEGRMNRSVADLDGGGSRGELLIISQFTLYADTARGNRPSYVAAARPDVAEPLIDHLVGHLRSLGATVATGCFGADMAVELVNDGPVTIALDVGGKAPIDPSGDAEPKASGTSNRNTTGFVDGDPAGAAPGDGA